MARFGRSLLIELRRSVGSLPDGSEERSRVIRGWLASIQARAEQEEGRQGRRQSRGVVYTPPHIARYIVDLALGGHLGREEQRLRDAHALGRIPSRHVHRRREAEQAFWMAYRDQVLRRTRVLDPACGSGAFLLAAFDRLFEEYQRVNRALAALRGGQFSVFDLNHAILLQNLYGVDLSDESVEVTRLSLWLKTAERDRLPDPLEGNIRHGNAVVADPAVDPLALPWEQRFPEVFAAGGFDVVVGNPPYVRQELLTPLKPYLESAYESYDGVADLYSYFCELGLHLLRPGGALSFVLTNKWMRAGYGRALRRLLSQRAVLERVVDFGHAPIFEGAEVFPCIIGLRKPDPGSGADVLPPVAVCRVPADRAADPGVSQVVRDCGYAIPRSRFGEGVWSLAHPAVIELLDRLRRNGVPLATFAGCQPCYGIKTGCNAAFVVDDATRRSLIDEDPSSAELLRPFLRGRDLGRWQPSRPDLYLIFTRRGIDVEAYPAVLRHLQQHRQRLEPRPPDWDASADGRWPGRKPGAYRWYELQDAVDYWEHFEQPKIVTQDLATHPWFCLDRSGAYPANTCYVWPTDDLYLLGWLCSPLAWWLMHRTLQRGINDTLRMFRAQVQGLPIAEPSPQVRRQVVEVVDELLEIAATEGEGRMARAASLEGRLSDLICEAHGLSDDEVALMWRTAPPRMPGRPGPNGGTGGRER